MRIKKSKRGLTFSFQENESFYAGAKYRYVVDRELDEVIIIPDKDGKYQMSRKGVVVIARCIWLCSNDTFLHIKSEINKSGYVGY